jgi:DNA-binding response OmpR family regulator
VDDSQLVHNVVAEFLTAHDFEVIQAFDGVEGFQKTIEFIPDLIIADIDMPRMDGYELCRQIKKTESARHIPIIMLSSHGTGMDIDKGFDVGVADYLTKPVNLDKLLSRIHLIIDSDTAQERQQILVVDDSKLTRDLMEEGLSHQGFGIITATNGLEALELAIQAEPNLVVTDLSMPIMNGRDLCRELRKRDRLKDIPVIMLTASGSERDRIKGEHAGVNTYLSKPFPPDKLVVLVEKLIAERKLLRERSALAESNTELQKRNQFIREIFGRYLTDEVVANLLESAEGLKLGGEKRKVTILMSDLRGFTSIAEEVQPEQVVSLLNTYLEAMTNVILKYEGTIDEFIGDGILVIFGAPIGHADDAQRAVACAVEMQLAMEAVNEQNRASGLPQIEMGIGLNTGEVVVGNIGSLKRAKYGMVGSHVNLTARIESYTVGGQILISEATLKETHSLAKVTGQIPVEPKGVKEPITIYQIGGIGGKYNLFLPEQQEELLPLEMEIPIRYTVLEEKFANRTFFEGRLVKLSAKEAEVFCKQPAPILSNLKLELIVNLNGQERRGDLYGKVVGQPLEGYDRFYLRFTAIPKEAMVLLHYLLAGA